MNQLAFPGLGTIMAGRRSGYVQATVMVVGFILTMVFFVALFNALLRLASDLSWSEQQFYHQVHAWTWLGAAGVLLCAVAWFWALVSSIAIVRGSQRIPPVLPEKRM